jgi:WD40 repeat protein
VTTSAQDKAKSQRSDVFISYSRKDRDFVKRLEAELQNRGREAWVDWEGIRPAEEFMQAIFPAIEGTDTFIFVLSPDSVTSEICGKELAHAVSHNKRMIPIMARDTEAKAVPEPLAKLNWVFARDADSFEAAADFLISALDTDLGWVRAHTRLLTRAIEWEGKAGSTSFVLRGEDLRAAEQWLAQAGTEKERQPTALQTEYIIASRKAAARRQRITLGAVTFGLVVALVLAVLAFYQRNIAEDRRRVAEARQLEAQAGVALDSSREGLQKSALLAVESLEKAWTIEGYIACTRAISLLPLRPNIRPAHKKKVLALAYSADGRWLASEDADATLVIWDTITKKQFKPETPPSEFIFYAGLAFSPDSKWLVSTSMVGNALVWNWNMETWQQVRKLPHGHMVWSVTFSPAGDLLSTASHGSSEVKLYRTSTWEEIAPWDELTEKQLSEKGHSQVRAAAFSQNGQWLATAGDSLTIWEMPGGKLSRTENLKAQSLAFSPDNRTLIAGGVNGGLTRIRLAEGMNAEPFAAQTAQVRGVEVSRDGRYLVSASGNLADANEVVRNGVVSVWDIESKHELLRVPREAVAAIFAPDGNAVVTGNADGTVAEWSTSRGAAVKRLTNSSPATAVAFGPGNGQYLVTASADGQMNILKMEADSWRQIASKELAGKVSTLGFSPNGQWLVAIADESLQLFSVPNWTKAPWQIKIEDEGVHAVSFSPDGKWIAVETRFLTRRHGYRVTSRVWELTNGRSVGWHSYTERAEPGDEPTSGGDLKLVESAASWPTVRNPHGSEKTADGRWVTFAGGTTLVDAQLQRPTEVIQHEGEINDATFSPNGRWLATASEDRTVRIWPLWAEDLLPLARLRLHRNLTYDEWRQAFENEPYSRTCAELPVHPSVRDKARELATAGDVSGATALFRQILKAEPASPFDPAAEARKFAEEGRRARESAQRNSEPSPGQTP